MSRARFIVPLLVFSCIAAPAWAGTLEDIRGRGVVTCAVPADIPGISAKTGEQRSGLAVDLCGVLAAAVLGRREAVAFIDVGKDDAVTALQAEEADVLLVPGWWRFAQEVNDGVIMVQPLLAHTGDGQVFGPMLRQGDDSWFVAVRWVLEALRKGQTSIPADAAEQGVSQLGLAKNWNEKIFAASGVYDQMLSAHMKALQAAGWTVVAGPDGMRFGGDQP
jgi:ABC-type amino acid transport substrate-binding protein